MRLIISNVRIVLLLDTHYLTVSIYYYALVKYRDSYKSNLITAMVRYAFISDCYSVIYKLPHILIYA